MARTVAIVPHTHWDREWYAPYQSFRLRLVDLLDDLLPAMEADPSYAHFLLDGQMAVVDDYLAVRPEAEPAIRRLCGSGRLAMGPWYVLMDEFLVSGETIVRNLQRGLDRAAAFGGAMEVGYLPDMFGHVAQMPQILRQAGFEHAVVWRGVPAAVTGTAFRWSAPDGSTVRAEYLPGGYGNGAAVPDDAKALLARIRTQVDELGDRLGDGPLLWMNGTDHQAPQPWLGRVVAEVDDIADDVHLAVVPLAEYLAAAPTDGLVEVTGELRSGARANLLMGVASNRVDVKQAAARAELALERRAEPYSALFLPAARWPAALLDEAWTGVIHNSAHDSVCACSVDEVCDAVLHRYAEARQVADGLADRALAALAGRVDTTGPVAVNSTARVRSGVVALALPGRGPVEGAQVLEERGVGGLDVTVPGRELGGVLAAVRSQEIEPGVYVTRVEVREGEDAVEVVLHASATLDDNLLMREVERELLTLAGSRPDTPFRVRVDEPPSRTVLARVRDVPGFGWAAWSPEPLDVDPATAEATAGDGVRLANGLVTVEVDAATGTFAVDGVAGFDRLVDGGDHGDTYNWSPPDTDVVVDRPESVAVDVVEDGPVRAVVRVQRTYRWPARVDDRARARVGEVVADVTTTIEVRAGERLVRVTTEVDNTARDHRLRTWFPLPRRATTSTAECAFATVERGTTAEGGPTEVPLPTFPSRRFVRAGGLTVVHEGLLEYELVERDDAGTASALALTLLRATGMLSRGEMTTRPLPAGPPVAMEGPQVRGNHRFRYGIALDPAADEPLDPWALADDLLVPLDVVVADRRDGTAPLPARGGALAVTGAEVSSVRREGGTLEVRVHNPSDQPATVTVPGRSGWLVDLRGRPTAPFDGAFALPPWAIATARLAAPGALDVTAT
jgi:mannosylglycerate hydrolase